MSETMEKLHKLLNEELDKIVKQGTISPTELENASKVVCLLKHMKEYEGYEAMESEGYSNTYGMSRRRGGNSYRGYDIRMTPYDESYRGYNSNNRGYSGHSIKDRMIDKLESMYDEAGSEHERQMLSEWISKIEMDRN